MSLVHQAQAGDDALPAVRVLAPPEELLQDRRLRLLDLQEQRIRPSTRLSSKPGAILPQAARGPGRRSGKLLEHLARERRVLRADVEHPVALLVEVEDGSARIDELRHRL